MEVLKLLNRLLLYQVGYGSSHDILRHLTLNGRWDTVFSEFRTFLNDSLVPVPYPDHAPKIGGEDRGKDPGRDDRKLVRAFFR